jgi:citrate lyase gamma subunit
LNSKEQIKVSIKFLSNELRSDSVQVNVHKKTCENINNCIVSKLENKFSSEIKEKILLTARSMKIEESKKDPKN